MQPVVQEENYTYHCIQSFHFYFYQEQGSSNSDLDITRAFVGSAQGFWVSFISMTTLGYVVNILIGV